MYIWALFCITKKVRVPPWNYIFLSFGGTRFKQKKKTGGSLNSNLNNSRVWLTFDGLALDDVDLHAQCMDCGCMHFI